MRKALQGLVVTCAVIVAASLVLVNTVYRNGDMSEGTWLVVVGLGLFVSGALAVVGGGALVATRRRAE